MAREAFLICDGCGRRVKDDTADAGHFVATEIKVNGSGMNGADIKSDLCRNCYDHLLDQADPSKWVRCATESMMDRLKATRIA